MPVLYDDTHLLGCLRKKFVIKYSKELLNEDWEDPIHLLFSGINKNKEYSNISVILKKRGIDKAHLSLVANKICKVFHKLG